MKHLAPVGIFAALISLSACDSTQKPTTNNANTTTQPATTRQAFQYPASKKVDHSDDYNGTQVQDSYRWLEELDAEPTRNWIKQQNEVTFKFLESIPGRDKLSARLTSLWNFERFSVPQVEAGLYFYSRNDGLQDQSVLYVQNSLEGESRVLLDPNTLSDDGTVALNSYSVSPDGRYLAYSVSSGGSDWVEWFVRDIQSGQDLKDHIKWSKFSGAAWAPDSSGFYYSAYDAPSGENELKAVNYYQKLYFHRIGTNDKQDALVYERPDHKNWGFAASVTDDGHYLLITVWKGTEQQNLVFYQDLTVANAPVVELISEFDSSYSFIANLGQKLFFLTDHDADNYRVISIDIGQDNQRSEIIAQKEQTLQSASLVGQHLILSYITDAKSQILIHDTDGKPVRELELPGIGSAGGFSGKADDPETFFFFSGFTAPSTIYRYDVDKGTTSVFRAPEVDFDPSEYVTEQVFYQSKDGTQVPMFIIHKKGLERTANNPTILYGYGGFNISLTPVFSISRLVWMEMGGIYAIANLRGGGEYGKSWHQAGVKTKKQNVFDDFIAAAEWLIDNNYTSSSRLAIQGGSNGGLLVGAAMTQRPELFAVALPAVGVMDMLRFNKFTIGWAWESDYGSPQNPEEFAALRAYSPLHNLESGTEYPATLVTTGDHDDRVFPAHSFKFAAALQEAHQGDNPVMIRVETRGGHGAGKPTSMQIESVVDTLSFTSANMDMPIKVE